MSKATKRKHVTRQVVEEFVEPQGSQKIVKVGPTFESQSIILLLGLCVCVQVLCGRGNNLHQVEEAEGLQFLASMPTKFRKNVWIKRGNFVVVEPIEEGNKVQAEIIHILFPRQIKYLKERNHWPPQFDESSRDTRRDNSWRELPEAAATTADSLDSADEAGDSDLFVNPNRPHPLDIESTSSEESDSDIED
jgi:probable RNA-binding protein EIF1AD